MSWPTWLTADKLAFAAFLTSLASLFFSLITAFPQIKGLMVVVRDAILWMALCFVLGGVGYVSYCQYQQKAEIEAPSAPAEGFVPEAAPVLKAKPAPPAENPPPQAIPKRTIRESELT